MAVVTAGCFTLVVDDTYTFGRIAAASACPTCTRWAASRRSPWNLLG
jgi:hypothetical protein